MCFLYLIVLFIFQTYNKNLRRKTAKNVYFLLGEAEQETEKQPESTAPSLLESMEFVFGKECENDHTPKHPPRETTMNSSVQTSTQTETVSGSTQTSHSVC